MALVRFRGQEINENTTTWIKFRASSKQKEILRQIARSQGYRHLSDFLRDRLFADLSIHQKLNHITKLLERKAEKERL